MPPARRLIQVADLTNREFLELHAAPGRVGLASGATWIDKRIRRSERFVTEDGSWSMWSHAFFFQGLRADGKHWVIEADVDLAGGQFKNGVQENRIDKYFGAKEYPALAVLDFGLGGRHVQDMMTRALDLVSARVRYSYTGILATWLALHKKTLHKDSPLHKQRRTFCSSFVQLLYESAGIRFAPGVTEENTTPEHIARTEVPHTAYLLERPTQRASGTPRSGSG